jgi:hypothetical protein
MNIKEVQKGKHAILYGDFMKQLVIARKCICGKTPCQGVITSNWDDDRYNSVMPYADTYDSYKKELKLVEEMVSLAHGNVNIVIETIQENYDKMIK